MIRTGILCIVLAFATVAVYSQIINPEPLSPRITDYIMDVRLNTESKTVTGSMEAFWVNFTSEEVPDIRLHMYMNAFRSRNSTMYKESGSSPGRRAIDRGWIDIISFTDREGEDLLLNAQYINPDDGNVDDSTVLQVMLPEPVLPGDTVFINVEFETKLPSSIRRTGYTDDFYFVAQWFPKFGVYEPAGMRDRAESGWNCHQFHRNSEFYANHSVYDVKITLPEDYVVGSGGMFLNETVADAEGNKTLTFRAEDIVDFAWTAWPGYSVYTDKWNHVNITLLLPEVRKNQVERQFVAVKNALEYLTENVGPFPWPHLTFVDPPTIGSGSAGMEYTTFFTSASADRMPEYVHMPEMVTVHEFGHSYFMGILATNEFEEPWMDEGINSFWEARIMDHYWGENSGLIDHPLLKVPDKSYSRLSYVRSDNRQLASNDEYSWNYPRGTYGMMSYHKATTWLYTLMGIVGEETINEIFREYYNRWAFRHPCARDFIEVVNDVVIKIHGDKYGTDMNWFFDQVLYGTGICDYKVNSFRNTEIRDDEVDNSGKDSLEKTPGREELQYRAIVQVERAGEVMLPVDILVHFESGDEVTETWDGLARYMDYNYEGKGKVEWVKIDPEYKLRMDVNFINNSLTADPDRVPVRNIMNKLLAALEFYLSFITL
jgi:hypothetical protein